ncbi:MAG: phosphoglycolate phosphatase [Neisseriaceae bacterium]|nr:phosphoglycolate phosphatase [Neisseriaceae bacterium]
MNNKKFNNIKAVAFDLDGTLADTIGDLADSANAMRAALNMPPLDDSVLLSFVGDGIGRLVHRALTNDHDSFAPQDLWEKGFALYVQYYAQNLCVRTQLYPQVADTLALLKTLKLPLAVMTNKSQVFAKPLLEQLKIADLFSLIIGGDTLPEKKPSALPLLHICEVLNIQAENLLMVGDSKNDILAARNAGSPVVGVSFGYGKMDELVLSEETKPDCVIHHFGQLYDLLKNIQTA